MVDVLLSDAEKVFIIHGVQVHNSEKRYLTFHALSIIHLPVLPVFEVWNMGYSAPWTLRNNLISSPGW
jgi:hypothetical protein